MKLVAQKFYEAEDLAEETVELYNKIDILKLNSIKSEAVSIGEDITFYDNLKEFLDETKTWLNNLITSFSSWKSAIGEELDIHLDYNFEDLSDWQRMMVASSASVVGVVKDLGKTAEGKTFNELKEMYPGKFDSAVDNGFGEYTIYKVNIGENGYSSITLKDGLGNLIHITDGTDETGDFIGDAHKVLMDHGFDALGGISSTWYDSQIEQARTEFEELAKEAERNGVKINIVGYSWGMTLAEQRFLYANELINSGTISKETLGDFIGFNGYHSYGLTDEQIDLITGYENLHLYAMQGDGVSTISPYGTENIVDRFANVTEYAYFPFHYVYNAYDKQNTFGWQWIEDIIGDPTAIFYTAPHYPLSYIGEHGLKDIIFDKNGNIRDRVELDNGTIVYDYVDGTYKPVQQVNGVWYNPRTGKYSYEVKGVSFEDISKVAFEDSLIGGANWYETGGQILETAGDLISLTRLDDVIETGTSIYNDTSDLINGEIGFGRYTTGVAGDLLTYIPDKWVSALDSASNIVSDASDGLGNLSSSGHELANDLYSDGGISVVGGAFIDSVSYLGDGVSWAGDKISDAGGYVAELGSNTLDWAEEKAEAFGSWIDSLF